jgi:hypothetical protein
LQMVGQDVSSNEHLQFKIMVKPQDKKDTDKQSSPSDSNPDILRIELMSDNDFFF